MKINRIQSRLAALPLALALGFTSLAHGYNPQMSKLYASKNISPQTNAQFGNATAANDKWILVGERGNDDLGAASGAVHVYNALTGAHVRRIKPQVFANDTFGSSVAVSGDIAVIGALGTNSNAGRAYVFNLATGVLLTQLVASDGTSNDDFGASVAISGNRILVGASTGNGQVPTSGTAYLFDATTGAQLAELIVPTSLANNGIGSSVAFSGSMALVAAPFAAGYTSTVGGAVFVFDTTKPGPTLQPLGALMASEGRDYDYFGSSLTSNGNQVFVGAVWRPEGVALMENGAIYAFNLNDISANPELLESSIITAPDMATDDHLGSSVAVQGNLLVAGAAGVNGGAGAIYLFDAKTGKMINKLATNDWEPNAAFGTSCALTNGIAVIGAPYASKLGVIEQGAAYVYRNLAAPLALEKIAGVKDSAPGTVQSAYSSLQCYWRGRT
jgi:FG-GAP repeat